MLDFGLASSIQKVFGDTVRNLNSATRLAWSWSAAYMSRTARDKDRSSRGRIRFGAMLTKALREPFEALPQATDRRSAVKSEPLAKVLRR